MISHNPKFAFIHVPKAAGSSIEYALRQYSSVPINFNDSGNAFLEEKHFTAERIKLSLGPAWGEYYSFGVARNPWDRVASNFLYLQSINHPMLKGANTLVDWVISNHVWCYPVCHYLLIDGKLAVDDVIHYEDLQNDFNRVCEKIGIQAIQLPHMNKSAPGKPYADYYDDTSRLAIGKMFSHDVALFGYEFGA